MSRVDLDELKRRQPIAAVAEQHGVRLRPQGRRLVGRCPFHEDRSPEPRRVSRDAVVPLLRLRRRRRRDRLRAPRRGIGFREAVERLGGESATAAQAAPAPTAPPPEAAPRRLSLDDRLILTAACELYHETLLRTPGILTYLETRGIPEWVARRCRVGYSDGRLLVPYLRRRRLSLHRARELGLLFRSDAETMAERVVVPDLRGAHCGWMVGRALDGRRQPRYRGLSLPRPLLGYDRARGHARVFVTEGPFDWLTLVSWGLPACALLGTQPGRDTLRLLGRARSVVLVLDADDAGREAAAQLATALGERARIVSLPDGVKDPSELGVHPDGRDTFFRLLDEAEGRQRDAAPAI